MSEDNFLNRNFRTDNDFFEHLMSDPYKKAMEKGMEAMSENKPKIMVVGEGEIGLTIAAHLGSSCQVEMIEMTAEQSETLFKKSRRGQTVSLAEAIEQDRTFPITNLYADLPEIRYPSTHKGKQRKQPTNFTKPKKRRR